MKIIFLEGLPGVGKTTILCTIERLNIPNVYVVDEIIDENILNNISVNEKEFMINEEMKLNKYSEGTIIIDRGPISLISYSQAKKIIDPTYDLTIANNWFNNYKNILYNNKIIYLTNMEESYSLTVDNNLNPYGTVENQKLLEAISLYNAKKYCRNLKVIEYHKSNMEEVINEIIS